MMPRRNFKQGLFTLLAMFLISAATLGSLPAYAGNDFQIPLNPEPANACIVSVCGRDASALDPKQFDFQNAASAPFQSSWQNLKAQMQRLAELEIQAHRLRAIRIKRFSGGAKA